MELGKQEVVGGKALSADVRPLLVYYASAGGCEEESNGVGRSGG